MLDLKNAEGKETFLRLVERCDVVLENYRAGALARLVLALSSGDLPAAGACLLADRLVDPKRLPLVRGGRAALDALLDAGAYGVCLAGAGPSLVGLTEESRDAERIGRAAVAAWERSGVAARARVHRIDRRGTRLAGTRA